jgi:DNA-binding NtrC family response regulator
MSRFVAGMEVASLAPEHSYQGRAMQIGVETSRAVENKRIFVVDDDDITRAVLQFMLQDENETHDLPTLTDAFANGQPDLLLLGISIVEAWEPGLLETIRQQWPGTRILIIAKADRDTAARPGAHGVLSRPFTVEAVRQKVDIQLGRIVPSLIQLQLVPSSTR